MPPPSPADPLASPWAASTAYWRCQWLGWGTLVLLSWIDAASNFGLDPLKPVLVVGGLDTLGGAASLGLTHALRAVLLRHGWNRLGWSQLLPRLAAGCASCAGAMTAAVVFVSDRIRPLVPAEFDVEPRLRVLNVALVFAYLFLMFASWCALYVGVQVLRRQRTAESDRWRLQNALLASELNTLRGQLNPHFLFNCLNGLRGLIADSPERAQDAVTRLANLLRYTLQAGSATTVTLGRELEIVRDYAELEQIRFASRFRFHLAVPAWLEGRQLPPLALQMLVENAVKHGVARRTQPTDVRVSGAIVDGFLELQVTNDGLLHDEGGSGGIALQNTRERLRRIFGPDARLELRSEPPERVVATLRLPPPRPLPEFVAEPAALPA